MNFKYFLVFISILLITGCNNNDEKGFNVHKEKFGEVNGNQVYIYTLTNDKGAELKITNFGASVVSLKVPDRNGKFEDVVTGYDSLEGYVDGTSFFGATVGRYGNRIGKGKFSIDGEEYQLTINDGENHLHGGAKGFYKAVWEDEPVDSAQEPSVKLTYVSPDGEEGYPGTVNMSIIYSLTKDNALKMVYEGTTDKPTILNPAHHSYFNLTGDFSNTILNHELHIDANSITPVDETLITIGELMPVENTSMDFRKPTPIGLNINDSSEQMNFGRGYDHNWVLNNYEKGTVRKVASLYDPQSGRLMEVLTDQPGLQFYSGNFLDGTIKGKDGVVYQHRTALCLEAQHYPDSPNKPEFPSVVLKPGETYHQTTIYKFLTK